MMPKLKMARMARSIAILVLLCGAGWTMSAASARAAVDGDLRAGVFVDPDAVGVGAGVLAPVSSDHRWFFNPNLEVGFGDNENIIAMNGDFHYDITENTNMSVWMGAGPAVLVTDPDAGSSRTDLGLNLLTGLGGTTGSVRPFAQLKGVVADQSQVVLQGGIRF
jgi:hypothetical protein